MSINPVLSLLETCYNDVKDFIEKEAGQAINFLLSFLKEAITEEEAALFPAFKQQVEQIFADEAKMSPFSTVKERVALAVAEATADLAADLIIAKNALFHSWAWAIAHDKGLMDGNQGNSVNGDFSGNTNSASVNPAA
jgi:ATP-dependent exoDNAse (exonuclease V) beta subunit